MHCERNKWLNSILYKKDIKEVKMGQLFLVHLIWDCWEDKEKESPFLYSSKVLMNFLNSDVSENLK
jgi:hypothetical protein